MHFNLSDYHGWLAAFNEIEGQFKFYYFGRLIKINFSNVNTSYLSIANFPLQIYRLSIVF